MIFLSPSRLILRWNFVIFHEFFPYSPLQFTLDKHSFRNFTVK